MTDLITAAQSVNPTLGTGGNHATFDLPKPIGNDQFTSSFGFQKINGKWYLDTVVVMGFANVPWPVD